MQISDKMVRAAGVAMADSVALNYDHNKAIFDRYARAALEAALSAMWQDISTAPKDGTTVLGYWKPGDGEHLRDVNYHGLTKFVDGQWRDEDCDEDYCEPDYWTSLPPPPKIEGQEGK